MESVQTPRHLWRWVDGVILLAVLLAAGGLFWLGRPRAAGQAAVITTPTGEQTYSLSTDREITLTGRDDRTVVIRIQNGQLCFAEAECPDQICVHSGWLTQAGDTAACVPAGMAVRITGDPPVDGIAG